MKKKPVNLEYVVITVNANEYTNIGRPYGTSATPNSSASYRRKKKHAIIIIIDVFSNTILNVN